MKNDDVLLLVLVALVIVCVWAYVKLLELEAMVYAVDTYRRTVTYQARNNSEGQGSMGRDS